jgi:hypothetical protein
VNFLDGSEAEIVKLLHGAWADDSCLVQAQCSLMDGGELIAAMLLCHGSLFRISNAVSSDLSFLRDFVPPNLALGSIAGNRKLCQLKRSSAKSARSSEELPSIHKSAMISPTTFANLKPWPEKPAAMVTWANSG